MIGLVEPNRDYEMQRLVQVRVLCAISPASSSGDNLRSLSVFRNPLSPSGTAFPAPISTSVRIHRLSQFDVAFERLKHPLSPPRPPGRDVLHALRRRHGRRGLHVLQHDQGLYSVLHRVFSRVTSTSVYRVSRRSLEHVRAMS